MFKYELTHVFTVSVIDSNADTVEHFGIKLFELTSSSHHQLQQDLVSYSTLTLHVIYVRMYVTFS